VDVTEVSRGGYRGGGGGGVMLSRGGSMPSPRGMMRGVASGMPLIARGTPAKAHPAAWGGRNSRQMYSRPGFLRGYEPLIFHYVFYRAMLCIRDTSRGPVSVCLSVRHESELY